MTVDGSQPGPGFARRRDRCRLCDASELTEVLSLSPSPPANAFVGANEVDVPQSHLPLDLWLCTGCGHLQLLDVVDPTLLFANYVYASGTSPVFVAHFERLATELVDRFGVAVGDLVVDIGSNDGTLLRFFEKSGQAVLGVDPAVDIARAATDAGIETLPTFFTPALAEGLRRHRGPARVVTANNVFAHVDDLSALTDGIRTLLAPDGIFVFEVSYLADIYQKTLFDTIYHEHLDYHSVGPLPAFFDRHGLQLVDAKRVDTHGGSLRGYVQHRDGPWEVSERVAELVELERSLALDRPETLRDFGLRIDGIGRELSAMLDALKRDGKRIAGFGAPAKATTLMHQFGIGPQYLDFIVDDSPLKQGLFSPGMHVPVLPSSALYERRPDYVVILAWNFAPSIMNAHRPFHDAGGRFIVPLPTVELV